MWSLIQNTRSQLRWMITFSSGDPTGYPLTIRQDWAPDFAKCGDNCKSLPVRNKILFFKNITVTVVTKLLCCTLVDMAVVSLVIINSIIPKEHVCAVHYLSIANFTKFQRGVYYSGIRIFNNLPHNIKELANETKLFRNVLRRFLLHNSFYNSEEYFNYRK